MLLLGCLEGSEWLVTVCGWGWLHDYFYGTGRLDQLMMHWDGLCLLLRHRCRSFALALDLLDPAFGAHTPSLHLFTPYFLAARYQVVVGALKLGVGLVRRQWVNTLVTTSEAKFCLVLDADFVNF
jgi:hypothetical protein